MRIDPREFENFAQIISAVVVPRPIALISSVSSSGAANLAPFSFFNVVSAMPPTIVVGVSRRPDGGQKDTLVNIESTGEFVVNLVNEDIAEAMNSAAADYAPDVDEFEVTGLTPAQSDLVKPPAVSESPVSMECRLEQVVSIGHDQPPNSLVIAEIVLLHVKDHLIDGTTIDHQALRPVGDLVGKMYCRSTDVFEMVRPLPDAIK